MAWLSCAYAGTEAHAAKADTESAHFASFPQSNRLIRSQEKLDNRVPECCRPNHISKLPNVPAQLALAQKRRHTVLVERMHLVIDSRQLRHSTLGPNPASLLTGSNLIKVRRSTLC